MRVLVIQHDHICLPGAVGERLRERGHVIELHQVVEADRFDSPNVDTDFPDPTDFDAIVALGAPWSAYDHESIGNWVPRELDLLRRAHEVEIPVLGICFGGQLLALAHGGEVVKSTAPELGWVGVQSDDEELVASGPWFQWHYDRWTVPAGATEVARNAHASQAFVYGRHLAVQFHPEMTPAILAAWFETGATSDIARFGLDGSALQGQTRACDRVNRERAHR